MTTMLWKPSADRIQQTNMYRFIMQVNDQFNKQFTSYPEVYQWSIDHITDFWSTFWDFSKIIYHQPYEQVIDDIKKMPMAKWFIGAKLNFAENLLRYRDDHVAIAFKSEQGPVRTITYADLYDTVSRLATSLKEYGIKPGDRISGFMPNIPETVIAMLATASLGAIWSSCSPDFGEKGVLDRFGQIQPKIVFSADGYIYKGKPLDSLKRVSTIIKQIPSIEKVIIIPFLDAQPNLSPFSEKACLFNDFIAKTSPSSFHFEYMDFNDPLYIMFTSGTTGLPKCMVQSAGGILINHLKEHLLHTDVKRNDTIFYFTTCGWMMWNWLVSGLSTGATIVLFDGNPFYPGPEVLWNMAEELHISIFGTSAAYISALEKSGLSPGKQFNLSALKTILSTGSPLSHDGFHYVYQHIKSDVQLSSISGGTDLNGCFALGNPIGPVFTGELQCRGLGMKVEAFDEFGKSLLNKQGELVCTAPFPSMPIYFWNDPDQCKYHAAYFDRFPGVWCHGDFIEINERGGVTIYGRSDATLNPGGVRIGTAEIYRQLEQFPQIEDSIVIGQDWKNDVRVILFIKLVQGETLTDKLKRDIVNSIRTNASPRHVPAKIISVPDVPYTLNMKKVELAVKKVIHNQPVLNKDALRNPEALAFFSNIKELEEE
ncbi:MAG: acetoacetate--CoA ligase [Desulfobacterales bacterium]|nr:acetoacetate--CoA ligase [Desulfobacterales bacterium]